MNERFRRSATRDPWVPATLRAYGAALLALLALAVLLRLPALGWLPAPNGDEGHWARYAERVRSGQPLVLDPEHRGSSPAFAYLLGTSVQAFDDPFLGMRLWGVAGVLLAAIACFGLLARSGTPRAGLTVAAILALHPWSVMWSRTASVPYALALSAMSFGCVAFWLGLARRSSGWVAAGVLAIAAAAHASPLAIVLVPPCLAFALARERRWLLRSPAVLLAGVAGALASVPLLRSMRTLPASEPVPLLGSASERLASAAAMILNGLSGESTVRHFTNDALPFWLGALVAAVLCALIAWACAGRALRKATPLAGFGLAVLASSIVLLPCVLAPARLWYLPTIDAERYVFALLPGLALCLGAIAEARRSARELVLVAASVVLLLAGSIRTLAPLAFGHGVAGGMIALEGGECYRGWLTTRDHAAPIALVAREARKHGAGAVLIDGYPLSSMAGAVSDLPPLFARFEDRARWKRATGLFLFVLWADAVMNAAASPRAADHNRVLRKLIRGRHFTDAKLERTILQPDGTPLLELWSARRRAAPDP